MPAYNPDDGQGNCVGTEVCNAGKNQYAIKCNTAGPPYNCQCYLQGSSAGQPSFFNQSNNTFQCPFLQDTAQLKFEMVNDCGYPVQ
jgi:hypothetical protein